MYKYDHKKIKGKIFSRGHIYDSVEEQAANELAIELMKKDINIVIAFAGTKKENGVDTGKPCVVFGVRKKIEKSNLPNELIIPKTLSEDILTDVIEHPVIKAIGTCTGGTSTACPPHGDKYRPLMGGISSINAGSTAGTLACIVKDSTDNTLVGLTCNHCLGQQYDTGYPTPDEGTSNAIGYNVLQPSPRDGGQYPLDMYGTVKRITPIKFGNSTENYSDSGIVTVEIDDAIPGILEIGTGPFLFTDKSYYNVGAETYKSGRTTGITPPPIATVTNKNVSLSVCYADDCYSSNNLALFSNQIQISAPSRWSKGGDSGSAVLVEVDGEKKIIGILFAGSSDGIDTFVSPSEYLVSILQVEAWNGDIVVDHNTASFISSNRICYELVEDTGDPKTSTVDEVFNSCEECANNILSSSSSSEMPSSD
jgi:hypothetical protein